MAEGLVRHDAGGRFEVERAGTKPGSVRLEAIAVMKELGMDITGQRSKHVDELADRTFDYVITVFDDANEICPFFVDGTVRIHKSFEDPPSPSAGSEEESLIIFRRVRDKLRAYLREFTTQAIA